MLTTTLPFPIRVLQSRTYLVLLPLLVMLLGWSRQAGPWCILRMSAQNYQDLMHAWCGVVA